MSFELVVICGRPKLTVNVLRDGYTCTFLARVPHDSFHLVQDPVIPGTGQKITCLVLDFH